jgi:cobalamin synthase
MTSGGLLQVLIAAAIPVMVGWGIAGRKKTEFHEGGRVYKHPFNPVWTWVFFVLMVICAVPTAYFLRHGFSRDWGGLGELVVMLWSALLTLAFFGAWVRRLIG